MDNKFSVLLYYHYKTITNIEEILNLHNIFCSTLNLKGRIIIAEEGINGTVSGPKEDCNKFKQFVENLLNIKLDFKDEECEGHLFPKLSIKIKKEIIKIGRDVFPEKKTGIHLKPKEFKIMMRQSDSIILDMRSNCEHLVGKFKNALTFDMDNMYQFPDKLENHKLFLDKSNLEKPILTYCTGGIKCEKASSFLIDKGFKNVYQLEGGIIRYGMEEQGEDFQGECYVFDSRITKSVNRKNPKIISKCYICKIKCNTMVNCMNTLCNYHTTICKDCYYKMDCCCSEKCSNSINKRKVYLDYYNKKNKSFSIVHG